MRLIGLPLYNYSELGRKLFPVQKLPPGATPIYGWNAPDGMLRVWEKTYLE